MDPHWARFQTPIRRVREDPDLVIVPSTLPKSSIPESPEKAEKRSEAHSFEHK
jgi:hypothetical protein